MIKTRATEKQFGYLKFLYYQQPQTFLRVAKSFGVDDLSETTKQQAYQIISYLVDLQQSDGIEKLPRVPQDWTNCSYHRSGKSIPNSQAIFRKYTKGKR